MNLYLYLLSALGIFILLRWLLSVVFSRIFGMHPLNQLYDLYLNNLTSIKFELSKNPEHIDQAWLYVAVKDVYILGTPGHSPHIYRAKYEYIRENITDPDVDVDGKVVILRELMKALPKNNHPASQRNLFDLIVSELKDVPKYKLDDVIHGFAKKPEFLTPKEYSLALSAVFAAWGASVIVYFMLEDRLVNFQIQEIGILIAGIILLSYLPLTRIHKSITQMFRYFVAVAAVVLLFFGTYASSAHRQAEILEVNLNDYGIDHTRFAVEYPAWLTKEDLLKCNDNNKVSILVEEGTLPPMRFEQTVNEIAIKNSDCELDTAQTNGKLNEGDRFEFHLYLLQPDALKGEKLSLTPELMVGGNSRVELIYDIINVYLEHPVWNFIRQWHLAAWPLLIGAVFSDVLKIIRNEKSG